MPAETIDGKQRVTQLAEALERWSSDDLEAPKLLFNHETSLLAFHRRVLALARDETAPLLERLRFLCISCTNLDEFFEVRVASTRQRIRHGVNQPGADGLSPQGTMAAIRERVLEMVEAQYRVLDEELLPALREQGIRIIARNRFTRRQRRWLHNHFRTQILPVLSPLGLDPAHPFPRILNKSLNFAVSLSGRDAFGRSSAMALVRAPRSLPRIIRIPKSYSAGPDDFVFLSSIVHEFIDELFPGMEVLGSYQFRVTRNSELLVDEEEVEDLARALEGELMERGFAEAVRLEVAAGCPEHVVNLLASKFGVDLDDVYHCNGPVNLNRMVAVYDLADRPDLKFPPFNPHIPRSLGPGSDLFASIRRCDHVLHHPYDSFQPVLDLARQAARDPQVLAIKQTLYRTGVDSMLADLLIEAARNGKDVTVVVELRARFDEEANISLATRMQEAGVQVVYGVVGHKAHAKMMLIVRREGRRLRRYVHLGTGNYHQGTAKAYTDWGMLSADPVIAQDVHRVFQLLSGYGRAQPLKRLVQSPFDLHDFILGRIEREAELARAGKPGLIMAKMNGLTEAGVIRALYAASRAGVRIRLVVRGSCCLRPGIPGLSENIRVRSVLGRFLEHSRVYHFGNDGDPETWASSADWMGRNLFQRVEVCFPIDDPEAAERVRHDSIDLVFREDVQAWELDGQGQWRLVRSNNAKLHVQELLMQQATDG
ncbi:polyphosphate kinase 1 [Wenzhouxiangella sediminis]|uniref:Polyphosphate kinase n=1 Tax=Wenzhouxiangella sediminis TaxID=1792836 RepID=A0A3E1K7P2_9GAMM|nr:polyphosphate kinase 1 [Wenzhouxiangella sediminis]RFF30064.1 polyphosphate kinase 1 [Wenzhouxiangella sediminis]